MNREDLIFASLCSFNITISKLNNVITKVYKTPSKLYNAFLSGDKELLKFFEPAEISTIKLQMDDKFIKKVEHRLQELNVLVITKQSYNIPKRIRDVFELWETNGLFLKGSLKALETTTCAIVGSRTADAYGRRVTTEFSRDIAKAGATIVSGLAAGVDSIAHNEAINNNALTIAVLGGGFNKIYPEFNTNLANKIIEKGGLLISEYPPHMQTQSYHFPVRNRIIAALSDAVLITAFKIKSGAMHTKNYAIDYGKDLFIPIVDIYRESCAGNVSVIDALPETAVVNVRPILNRLKLEAKQTSFFDDLTKDEITIVKILKQEEKHFDDIVKISGFNAQKVNVLLTTLKINGIIKELAGNFFSL